LASENKTMSAEDFLDAPSAEEFLGDTESVQTTTSAEDFLGPEKQEQPFQFKKSVYAKLVDKLSFYAKNIGMMRDPVMQRYNIQPYSMEEYESLQRNKEIWRDWRENELPTLYEQAGEGTFLQELGSSVVADLPETILTYGAAKGLIPQGSATISTLLATEAIQGGLQGALRPAETGGEFALNVAGESLGSMAVAFGLERILAPVAKKAIRPILNKLKKNIPLDADESAVIKETLEGVKQDSKDFSQLYENQMPRAKDELKTRLAYQEEITSRLDAKYRAENQSPIGAEKLRQRLAAEEEASKLVATHPVRETAVNRNATNTSRLGQDIGSNEADMLYFVNPKLQEAANVSIKALRKIAGVFSTERPLTMVGAKNTGQELKIALSKYAAAEEKAIKLVRDLTRRGLQGDDAADVFFAATNPAHMTRLDPETRIRIQPFVEETRHIFDEYGEWLQTTGVLDELWPQSAISQKQKLIDEMTGKLDRIRKGEWKPSRHEVELAPGVKLSAATRVTTGKKGLNKRAIDKLEAAIKQEQADIEKLQTLRHVHFPARLWLEDIFETDPNGFRSLLSGNFAGIKGRKTIDPYDLVESGVLDKKTVDVRDAIGVYTRYVHQQMAQRDIREAAIRDGLAIADDVFGTLDDAAKGDFANFVRLDDSRFPAFSRYKLHPEFADRISDYFTTLTARQGAVARTLSVTKMLQFYNPIIMPMYDTYQASALTQGQFAVHLKQAARSVMKKDKNYFEAYDNGLFSTPYKNPFFKFQEALQKNKEAQSFMTGLKNELAVLGRDLKTGNVPKFVVDTFKGIYNASWNTAWSGDKVLRMASYHAMRKRGYSVREAAQMAAEAHADYAGVPPETRRTLNKIFFTPTFQISMLKWFGKMTAAVPQLPMQLIRDHKADPHTVARVISLASAAGLLMARHHLITDKLGWKSDKWGRRYFKEIPDPDNPREKKRVVVTFSDPLNVPLKYYYNYIEDQPGIGKFQQIGKNTQYLLHPVHRMAINFTRNQKADGSPIVNPFTSKTTQAIDASKYVAFETVGLMRGLMDESENTKGEALKRLRQAGDTPWNQLLGAVAFLYTGEPEGKRIRQRAQSLMRGFTKQMANNPPDNMDQLDDMYDILIKNLDDLYKQSTDIENKRYLKQSLRKQTKNKHRARVVFQHHGGMTDRAYEQFKKKKE